MLLLWFFFSPPTLVPKDWRILSLLEFWIFDFDSCTTAPERV